MLLMRRWRVLAVLAHLALHTTAGTVQVHSAEPMQPLCSIVACRTPLPGGGMLLACAALVLHYAGSAARASDELYKCKKCRSRMYLRRNDCLDAYKERVRAAKEKEERRDRTDKRRERVLKK